MGRVKAKLLEIQSMTDQMTITRSMRLDQHDYVEYIWVTTDTREDTDCLLGDILIASLELKPTPVIETETTVSLLLEFDLSLIHI